MLVGLLLRVALMQAIPVGYFGDDSFSYYEFSQRLFDDGVLDLNEKRRWLYPIFLAFVDALPAPGWYVVPLIQHIVGLLTVLGIGWCSAQLVMRPMGVLALTGMITGLKLPSKRVKCLILLLPFSNVFIRNLRCW